LLKQKRKSDPRLDELGSSIGMPSSTRTRGRRRTEAARLVQKSGAWNLGHSSPEPRRQVNPCLLRRGPRCTASFASSLHKQSAS
jgi:hypothetical protein